jgi:hypothetical protein
MRTTLVLVFVGALTLPIMALAQQAPSPPSPKGKSPGEIAAWSAVLAQRHEDCQRQARALKLGYWKRRQFMRDCVKKAP